MPNVIDYAVVLEHLQKRGLKSLYHNSGAFWFLDQIETMSRGWIGPPDSSIAEAARSLVHQATDPFAEQLAMLLVRFWLESSPGVIWIMPKSHWAFELQFGNKQWLPAALKESGLDSTTLSPLNNAAAIEFAESESQIAQRFICELLAQLAGSDFQLIFADCRTICTIHSRTQLWWTTIDTQTLAALDLLLP